MSMIKQLSYSLNSHDSMLLKVEIKEPRFLRRKNLSLRMENDLEFLIEKVM